MREWCVAHTAVMSHCRSRRGHLMCVCSTHGLSVWARIGLHEPSGQPCPHLHWALLPALCCPPPALWWVWNLQALHGSLKKYHPGKWGRSTLWLDQIIFFPVCLLKNDWEEENKIKKLILLLFNTACGVLISHAFFGPLFLALWSAI